MLQIPLAKLEAYKERLLAKKEPVPFQIEERGTDSGSFILSYEDHKFKASKAEHFEPFSSSDLRLLAKIKSEASAWIRRKSSELSAIENRASELYSELENLLEWQRVEDSATIQEEIAGAKDAITRIVDELERAQFLAEDARGVQWTKSFFFHYRPANLEACNYADFGRVEEILSSPATALQSAATFVGPSLGSPYSWRAASYKPRHDVAELDLNQAYATAALAEGIISAKTFEALGKASKAFRLVAFGALATRSQITEYNPVKEVVWRNVNFGKSHGTTLLDQVEFQTEAQFEAAFKKQAFFPTIEQFASVEGWEKSERITWKVMQHAPTRPITAPAFFHVAAKVGRDMEQVAKAANAYFFWVDAIFCPRENVGLGAEKAQALGYQFKIKNHQSVSVKDGVIKVLKAGESEASPYGIPPTRIDKAAAGFNFISSYVKAHAKTLTASELLQLANKKLEKGQLKAILAKLGLSLSDLVELVTVTRDGYEYEAGTLVDFDLEEDQAKLFRLVTTDALQKLAEVENVNTVGEKGVTINNWWMQIKAPKACETLQEIAENLANSRK